VAITHVDYLLWRGVAQAKILPPKPDLLELGESNWYQDVDLAQLAVDIREFITDPDDRDDLLRQLTDFGQREQDRLFQIARVFYQTFLRYRSKVAIDLHGTELALKFDLNEPLPIANLFDVVVNVGTAEHVFNQDQFFRTAHERCKPGGYMMHNLPLTGWFDHGFYSYGPTFVVDLAAANNYRIVCWLLGSLDPPSVQQVANMEAVHALQREGKIPPNCLQYVLYRKGPEETPFHQPMQGYYAGTLSQEAAKDWSSMR
jgi:SAM-dependent methyltransferase